MKAPAIFMLLPVVFGAVDFNYGQQGDLIQDMYSRDSEALPPGPLAWGHKYMGGGAGEGSQYLSPEGLYPNKQEVKTDSILPAYCEPPNPCPPGFTSKDGCMEDFENTADFSRDYQSRQTCLCDEEHMFSCPQTRQQAMGPAVAADEMMDFSQALEQLLQKADLKDQHKVVAKKFHEKKRGVPRKKRAARRQHVKTIPSLYGEEPILSHRAKKGKA